jgi:hypothetical protein
MPATNRVDKAALSTTTIRPLTAFLAQGVVHADWQQPQKTAPVVIVLHAPGNTVSGTIRMTTPVEHEYEEFASPELLEAVRSLDAIMTEIERKARTVSQRLLRRQGELEARLNALESRLVSADTP